MLKRSTYILKYVVKKKHVINASVNNFGQLTYAQLIKKMTAQKHKLRSKKAHYSAYLKVIGSGAPGAPSSIYLITDQANYLFNCGEGTQRISHEQHCKLAKTDNIFITNLSWKNIGGLPGLLLTAQDNSLPNVTLHGPNGLSTFMANIRTFTYYASLAISYGNANVDTTFKDDVMTVTYVPITRSVKHIRDCSRDSLNEEACNSNKNGKRPIDAETTEENTNVPKKMKHLPDVISYICKLHPRQGKLLTSKCIDFGVPPGPLYSDLKAGNDVVKDDGTVVRSQDVRLPDSPATIFLVVECPTEEYMDSFVNHPAFLECQQTANQEGSDIYCIVHFTPEKIFNMQQYQDWVKTFPSTTEHIVFRASNTCMGSESVYKNQYILNLLHPEIFPLLNTTDDRLKVPQDIESKPTIVHSARTAQVLHMRPTIKPIIMPKMPMQQKSYTDAILRIPHFMETFADLQINIEKKTAELDLSDGPDYPRILMLGTGSSVPNKVRNTSGILVRIDAEHSILLDCGEGTLGQIIRFYGRSESDNILLTIKAIYVSHIHADHHLGLMGLLLRRKELTDERVYLLAPSCIAPWLNFYNERFESVEQQYILQDNSDLYKNYHHLSSLSEKQLYDSLNIKTIDTTYVVHCHKSYGIAITLKDGKKIVYSGDTMFSKNLVELGKDCDLLIHEATMDDKRDYLARRSYHSTTSEAIRAGKMMNAKFTLLTHFSQRYSKIPELPETETSVGLAYDNMNLKFHQLPLLHLFYPCLKIMFSKYNKVSEQ